MPTPVTCPSCGARLTAPDAAAGKSVQCPKCHAAVPVPAADGGFEVVDDPPPRRAAPVAARPVSARPVRDDEDDTPRFKRRRPADDEDDDRPRKKPARAVADDDDEDDRPRRKAKKAGIPVWVFAAGGAGLLLIVGVVAVVAFGLGGRVPGAGGLLGRSPPPGFTELRDPEGGYRVHLPGQVRKAERQNGQPPPPGFDFSVHAGTDGNVNVLVQSLKPGNNFNPGTSPDELYGLLKQWGLGVEAPWNEVVAKTPVTLGGKPGLEVRVSEKKNWMDDGKMPEFEVPSGLPPAAQKDWEDGLRRQKETRDKIRKDNEARPGRREVYFVTTNGTRVVIIRLETKGDFPGDDVLKTVRESFEFL